MKEIYWTNCQLTGKMFIKIGIFIKHHLSTVVQWKEGLILLVLNSVNEQTHMELATESATRDKRGSLIAQIPTFSNQVMLSLRCNKDTELKPSKSCDNSTVHMTARSKIRLILILQEMMQKLKVLHNLSQRRQGCIKIMEQ